MHKTIGLVVVLCTMIAVQRAASAGACTTSVYHPAAYTNGGAGDVALTTAESQLVQGLIQNLGLTWGHAAVLYNSSGYVFTESTVNNSSPPSSNSTGEPHICSRVISPYYLSRMPPGVLNATARDARAGVLVKGGARASCIAPLDTYHVNSIKNRKHGGSCAAFAEDDCGASVTGSWQRTFTATNHYNEAIFLYTAAYNQCLTVIGGLWPWMGIGCGGVSSTGMYYGLGYLYGGAASACDRAASQVVNEFAVVGSGTQDGWSEYSVFGQLLGASKTNFQPQGWWYGYVTKQTASNVYDNPTGNWTPRVPDNIYASAAPTGHAIVGTNIAGAYYTTTTAPDGACCGAQCCGSCWSGSCDTSSCGGGGGGPAVVKL